MRPSPPRPPIRPTLRQRFEFRAARMLFSLPAAVQLKLSRRPPVVVDGCTLHPQMQLLLALRDLWRGAAIAELTPEIARANFRNDTATIYGRPIAVGGDHRPGDRRRAWGDRGAPLRAGGRRRAAAAGLLPRRRLRARRPRRPRQSLPPHLPRRRPARALGRLPARARAPLPGRGRRCARGLPLCLRQRRRARRAAGQDRGRRRQRRRQSRGGGRAEDEGRGRPGAVRADAALSGARPHGRAAVARTVPRRLHHRPRRHRLVPFALHRLGRSRSPTRRSIPCSPRTSPASRRR